jgi:hypothetical protein
LTIAGLTFTVHHAGVPCTFTFTPPSRSINATGGTGSFTVASPTGCSWTATSSDTWLTVTGGATGSGGGTVNYSVAANSSTSGRSASISVGGQAFTVNQAGVPCGATINPVSQSVPAGGGSTSTSVSGPAGCSWSAVSNDGWLTVTGGNSGSGPGVVNVSAGANASSIARTGTVTIGDQTFSVNQPGVPCTFSLNPTSRTGVPAAGATGSLNVTAPAGCSWTATSNSTPWLTVTGQAGGSGNGVVNYNITANTGSQTRNGSLSIGGQTFSVSQLGVTCTITLNPTGVTSVPAGGATGTTQVTAPSGCTWTAASNNTPWLTVTAGASGTGNGVVSYNITGNTASTLRNGSLTIGGQSFSVQQLGAPCSVTISPTNRSGVPFQGLSGSFNVTAAATCSWTATSNNLPWLTVTGTPTGTGNRTVNYTVSPNSQTTNRTGTITVANRTFTLTQNANTCAYTLIPASASAPAAGGSGTIQVSTIAGCAWQAQTTSSWITPSGSGTTLGQASYTVAANPTPSPRTGTITIGTKTFTISQAAGAPTGPAPPAPAGLRIVGGQ